MSVLNGQGNGSPLRYSCLENLMDRGAWSLAGHGPQGRREPDTTEAMKHTGTSVLKYLFKEVVERTMIKLKIYLRKTQVHLLS